MASRVAAARITTKGVSTHSGVSVLRLSTSVSAPSTTLGA